MNLAEFIESNAPVVFDGAMGTQLAAAGVEMGGQNCITNPDVVAEVHKKYLASGCDVLITNTFTMNRIYVESHKLPVDLKEVNVAGAKLAKAVTGDNQFVVGDMSSTGQMLEPYGTYTEEQFVDNYKEQAEFLLEGGVDGLVVETMMDLREAACAVRACRSVTDLPVIASMSFQTTDKGGRTMMGNSAAEIAKGLAEAGASAVGGNCGDLDPNEMAMIVAMMKEATGVAIIAQPNGGKPKLVDGKTIFDMGPEDFAKGLQACVEAGATLVGGCCGTSPAHLKAAADLIKSK